MRNLILNDFLWPFLLFMWAVEWMCVNTNYVETSKIPINYQNPVQTNSCFLSLGYSLLNNYHSILQSIHLAKIPVRCDIYLVNIIITYWLKFSVFPQPHTLTSSQPFKLVSLWILWPYRIICRNWIIVKFKSTTKKWRKFYLINDFFSYSQIANPFEKWCQYHHLTVLG